MSPHDDTCPRTSLTTLPLEIFRTILDKVYEEPHTLIIVKPLSSIQTATSNLPISPLQVNHHFYTEALNAIRRSKSNIIKPGLHASFPDTISIPLSPSLSSFFISVTILNLIDFPYESSVLKSWKQTCPDLRQIHVEHTYSTTIKASLHRVLLTPDFPSLLRGDVDADFAATAIARILHVHPEFHLDDLGEDIHLTFPNTVDFWSPSWGRKYYHENRVLVSSISYPCPSEWSSLTLTSQLATQILSLTITQAQTFVSQKSFKNRLRGIEYRPHKNAVELPRFPGVDYNVRFVKEGNEQNLDYDWRKDCFCSPYSSAGVS